MKKTPQLLGFSVANYKNSKISIFQIAICLFAQNAIFKKYVSNPIFGL